MRFDFSTLITDRSSADLDKANDILARANAGTSTPVELEELYSGRLKGAYDYTDLNRVTDAMEYLNQELWRYGYYTGYTPVEINHQGGQRLPDGYTELEYIQSSKTQHINTGVIPTQKTGIVLDAEVLSENTGTAHHFASVLSNRKYFIFRLKQDRTGFAARWGTQALKPVTHAGDIFSRHTFSMLHGNATIDGSAPVSFTPEDWVADKPIPLFGYIDSTGAVSEKSALKLYSCKIYDDSSVVRNFVPAKAKDSTVGLYDLVEKVFYKNAGTGSFTPGPEIDTVNGKDPHRWYEGDAPTSSMLQSYLDNVKAIRSALTLFNETPQPPDTIKELTIQKANDIEKVLADVESVIHIMEQTFVPCGPATCGGDYL